MTSTAFDLVAGMGHEPLHGLLRVDAGPVEAAVDGALDTFAIIADSLKQRPVQLPLRNQPMELVTAYRSGPYPIGRLGRTLT